MFAKWLDKLQPSMMTALRYAAAVALTVGFLVLYKLIFGSGHPYLVGLFPVILCAVFLREGPSVVSLVLTAVFIDRYEAKDEDALIQGLGLVLVFAEGFIVIWIAAKRRHARARLAEALRRRSGELKELQTAYDELSEADRRRDLSNEQLKRSNKLMLDTLERILDRPDR